MKSIFGHKNAGRFQTNVRLQCRKEINYIDFSALQEQVTQSAAEGGIRSNKSLFSILIGETEKNPSFYILRFAKLSLPFARIIAAPAHLTEDFCCCLHYYIRRQKDFGFKINFESEKVLFLHESVVVPIISFYLNLNYNLS